MHKTIILEPAECKEKCVNVRSLFKEQILQGTVEVVSMDTDKGKKLAEVMGLGGLSEPVIMMITDAGPKEPRKVEIEPVPEEAAETE